MALLFLDSFEHYSFANRLIKWTKDFNSSDFTMDATSQLSGVQSMKFTGGKNRSCLLYKVLSANKGTLVLGGRLFQSSNSGDGNYWQFMFYDGATNQIEIRIPRTGIITVYRNGTLIGTSLSGFWSVGEKCYIEVKVVFHGSAGSVEIRKNGVVFYTLSSVNTSATGNAYANCFAVGFYNNAGAVFYLDDVYLDDTNYQGDCKVECLLPSGAGASTQFTPLSGNNYENVDDAQVDSDTTYNHSVTAGHIDTYAFGNLSTPSGTVKGVQVNMVARKDDAGSRVIQAVARPGSTNRLGSSLSIGDSYIDYMEIWEVNPDTAAAWAVSEVNASEFGIKLTS